MATIQDVLNSVSLYPTPLATVEAIALRRGVSLSETATEDILKSGGFNLAKADLLMWLSFAPQVTQGGQSYSFTDEQRQQFRNEARGLYQDYASDDSAPLKPIYGYKGSRL